MTCEVCETRLSAVEVVFETEDGDVSVRCCTRCYLDPDALPDYIDRTELS